MLFAICYFSLYREKISPLRTADFSSIAIYIIKECMLAAFYRRKFVPFLHCQANISSSINGEIFCPFLQTTLPVNGKWTAKFRSTDTDGANVSELILYRQVFTPSLYTERTLRLACKTQLFQLMLPESATGPQDDMGIFQWCTHGSLLRKINHRGKCLWCFLLSYELLQLRYRRLAATHSNFRSSRVSLRLSNATDLYGFTFSGLK